MPIFILNSVLFGVGLSMDAFSAALVNGLNAPCMRKRKMLTIAGVFAFFQALMPLIGWALVHTVIEYFRALEGFIPWAALILLLYIGGKMLFEGLRAKGEDEPPDCAGNLTLAALIVQGIATSIDALSVGFTIADLSLPYALLEAAVIAAVTFAICMVGILIGRKFGSRMSSGATVFGGIILIAIGLEIFISSFF